MAREVPSKNRLVYATKKLAFILIIKTYIMPAASDHDMMSSTLQKKEGTSDFYHDYPVSEREGWREGWPEGWPRGGGGAQTSE